MKFYFIFFLCLLSLTVVAQKEKRNLAKDKQEMLALFEGEFDNFEQVYKEKEDKVAEMHEHIHSVFKKIPMPVLGQDVFYVLQYLDGDSTKIYRQRLYNFTEDKTENAIRLDIYNFKTDSLYYHAHIFPDKLKNLTQQDLTTTEGCAVYWKKSGDDFIGYMKKGACNFLSKRSNKKIFITDSLKLNKTEIWINDQATDENENYVFGHKGNIPHKLKRCNFYTGWIILQKAGFDNDYHSMRNLRWHDQGKRIRLYTEEGKATKYEVELATVIYGKDVEVLKIAVYEIGVSKAITYSWTSPLSDRVGVNLRWIQAGLTRIK